MSIRTSPCSWEVDYCGAVSCEPLASLPASGQAVYEAAATDYLWRWTGKRFGLCEVQVRPCRDNCTDGVSTYRGRSQTGSGASTGVFEPVLIGGEWFNIGCGYCGDRCGCTVLSSVALPGPVDSITNIDIDGVTLDPSAYRVDASKYLVRIDGGVWPLCQDLASPSGGMGTWTVTYQVGIPVPVGGQIAAGVLACELAKAACGDRTCGLPQRVQTITRQGVSVAMLDAFDDLDSGHTGIWIIDSWVASVTKEPRASRVYSPDMPRTGRVRRQTWPNPTPGNYYGGGY